MVFEHFSTFNTDLFLDSASQFINIIKIHETYYYNDTKISSNKDFNKSVFKIFNKIEFNSYSINITKTYIPEELWLLISDYQTKLYNEDKMLIKYIENYEYSNSLVDLCYFVRNCILEKFDKDSCKVYWEFTSKSIYHKFKTNSSYKNVDYYNKRKSDYIDILEIEIAEATKKKYNLKNMNINDLDQEEKSKILNYMIKYLKLKILKIEDDWKIEIIEDYIKDLNMMLSD
jgi:hypothetical protein